MVIDYLSPIERKKVIDEILTNEENLRRKENSLMSLEVFKGRQEPFIYEKLRRENNGSIEQIKNGRTITSINLTRKIIKEKASLYRNAPVREFSNVNEAQDEHIRRLYDSMSANVKLKKSNEIYKLQEQSALQAVLKNGKIELRPLYGHHYDVIPSDENPEKAEAYIVSSFDKSRLFSNAVVGNFSQRKDGRSNYFSDFVNQTIADVDDYRKTMRFYWWTKDFNFVTDGSGNLLDEAGQMVKTITGETDPLVASPILGTLPFIDIATDKDFEFFVRSGHSSSVFSVDLGALLSDTAEIARMQGWSQAIIASVEQPKDMTIGPRKALWLKLNPNDTEASRPSFSFVSPNPDLQAGLQLIENFLSLYLTSEGLSPSVVNSGGKTDQSTSGLDRWLKMLEKFEMSQDDADMYQKVEQDLFGIVKAWNNAFYNVTENGFEEKLSGVFIPEDSDVSVKFHKPDMLMGENEKIDLIQKKLELGLISQVDAIEMDRQVNRERAVEILNEIRSDDVGEIDAETE